MTTLYTIEEAAAAPPTVRWRTLHQHTRKRDLLPDWTPLTELPVRQLTSGIPAMYRVIYLPQEVSELNSSPLFSGNADLRLVA